MRKIKGVPVDPKLPRAFWTTANERRPLSHGRWWYRPFVRSCQSEAWPGGLRFDVYCLDGGAWDRPTVWGCFGSLEEAVSCARELRAAYSA